MQNLLDRRQHSVSSWLATITCEGTAFTDMLRDLPESTRVAHTRAKMCEINRARARRVADRAQDCSHRTRHDVRDEQIMLGEMLIDQIVVDVCHALLNLGADPWQSVDPEPALNTQTSTPKTGAKWQQDSDPKTRQEPESDATGVRVVIPSDSSAYAAQWITVDGKQIKVLASVVTALRAVANSRANGAKIRTDHFKKLQSALPWLAKKLTRDYSQKTTNKLATYTVPASVKKTIRVKTVSNE